MKKMYKVFKYFHVLIILKKKLLDIFRFFILNYESLTVDRKIVNNNFELRKERWQKLNR